MSAGAVLSCAKASPGSTGSGGSNGSGGAHASGGSNGSGGSNSSGGSTGAGGSNNSGGATGSGGAPSSGGSTGSGGSSPSGSGGSNNSGGSTGSGGSSSSGGSGGSGSSGSGGSSPVSDAGADASCQTATYTFAPKIPTVFVLVDQSGSEFSNGTTSTFYTLRTAALNVINNLQAQVRFGVGIFTGQTGQTPSQCPIWNTVAPALNNYAAINTLYAAQVQPQFKAETPAVQVLPLVQQALASDAGNGAKYILFVTDSETDFCDDGAPDCPVDAVTYQLQTLWSGTPSIGTLIIGLPLTGDSLAPEALQNYANAGAGQPVVFPTAAGVQTQNQLYETCKTRGANAGQYSWPNLYAATGKPATDADGAAIATYGPTAGTAKVYSPASTSETDLENQISAAINGVKSCTFDLSDINGKSLKVDTTMLAKANVMIEGKTILQDSTNGWSMGSSTQLVLNGTACTTWQTPNNNDISFNFPCSTIIFE